MAYSSFTVLCDDHKGEAEEVVDEHEPEPVSAHQIVRINMFVPTALVNVTNRTFWTYSGHCFICDAYSVGKTILKWK